LLDFFSPQITGLKPRIIPVLQTMAILKALQVLPQTLQPTPIEVAITDKQLPPFYQGGLSCR
jgi:hypothetical protein